MTDEQIALEIAKGLVATGVEGGFDAVSCSTAGDYVSVGCSQWEGPRGDELLAMIPGGDYYIGRTYSEIEAAGELGALAALLDSPEGQEAQLQLLAQDCIEKYLPALAAAGLTNLQCILYCGIWCPTNHDVVRRFCINRAGEGIDINDLDALHEVFFDRYARSAGCEEYTKGYQNRAVNTYNYVVGKVA